MRIRTSSAAEFQSMQTRAIMGAALWSRALGIICFLWIALTLWLVWHRVGLYRPEVQHELFGRWALCSVLTDIPPCSTAYQPTCPCTRTVLGTSSPSLPTGSMAYTARASMAGLGELPPVPGPTGWAAISYPSRR